LRLGVVAAGTEGLEVLTVPEQLIVTLMFDDVVDLEVEVDVVTVGTHVARIDQDL